MRLPSVLHLAVFVNANRPRAYGVQKLPSEGALALLVRLVKQMNIEFLASPQNNVDDYQLLTSILVREWSDPPGFRGWVAEAGG